MEIYEKIKILNEFSNLEDEQIYKTVDDATLFLTELYEIPNNLLETARYYYACYLLSGTTGLKLKSVQLTEVSETYDVVAMDWLTVFDRMFNQYKKVSNPSLNSQNAFTVF